MEDNLKAQSASTRTLWTYGFGSIGVGIKNNLLGTWLLFYYNAVLGLEAWLVTLAIGIALVIDALSDPFVGIWSDRVRTRWGRRHPFMYGAVIPFALCYYLILQDPGDISDSALFTRLLVLMILMRIAMTFYEVPRGALAPELTKDYDQRNIIAGIGMALGWIGGAGISFIHMEYFLVDSFSNGAGYQLLAFWGGLGIFVSTVITTVGTHSRIPHLHVPPVRSFKVNSFFREAKETLSNRSWIVLFASGCIYALVVGTDTGAGTYYNNYFWEWKPTEISTFAAWNAASVVFIALFAPRIAIGRSKKKIAVGIFLTSIVVGPLPMVLRLLEPQVGMQLFPSNGTDLIWWILLIHSCALVSIGSLGFIFITSMAMEIVEDVEKATGRREEGLLGTVSSMIQKLIGAGGVLIAGAIITWAGFDDPGVTEEMKSGVLIDRFAIIHVAIGFFLPIISTLLILKYDIDRKGHLDNVNDLGYVEKN